MGQKKLSAELIPWYRPNVNKNRSNPIEESCLGYSEFTFCCQALELGDFPNEIENFEEENEIIDALIYAFCSPKLHVITLSLKYQKEIYELARAVGFEEVCRWKSGHGDYPLVMLSNYFGNCYGE